MDNSFIFRTVLIIIAAFVLFALMNYYNNKQETIKSEKFYEQATAVSRSPSNSMAQNSRSRSAASAPMGSGGVQSGANMVSSSGNVETFSSTPSMTNGPSMLNTPSLVATNSVNPSDPLGDLDFRAVDYESQKLPSDCFPKDRTTVDDLLPKDAANSKWAQVNPAGQGDVKDQNFLTAGYMFGINTVGSSLKNANLQLRSEPVIPKVSVGPFLNSSYEASDALRRPLEIGGNC